MLVDTLVDSASRCFLDQNFVAGAGWLFVPSLATSSLSGSEYDGRDSCSTEKLKTKRSSSSTQTMYPK